MADQPHGDLSDASFSPSDFVQKIQLLSQKRNDEDAQRIAALESQIQKDREVRAIRRAERARSLSPEKSPASSTPPIVNNSLSIDAKKMAEDRPESPPATQLSRSGTLSWQQRPKSSHGRRPLSMIAAENAARSPRGTPTPEPGAEDGQELSRAQIAKNLQERDPTWFRPRADRGIGSAAYRRSQEDLEEAAPMSGRMKLPGMSNESSAAESPSSPPLEENRSTSPSRASSVRGSAAWSGSRYSQTTNASETGSLRIKSPPPSIMDVPKLDPPTSDRISPLIGRPPSPTKGMGGFVESAMMKRADSVSKRWSQQGPPGLSRQSSTASNRSSYYGVPSTATLARPNQAPSSLSRDNSLEPGGSRPNSSHSNMTATRTLDDSAPESSREGFVKPALPHHNRSKSVASISVLSQGSAEPMSPSSPSKRWSPTKSSWLESALTKTEEKAKTPAPPPAQPSWMTEINKSKQARSISPPKDLEKQDTSESVKPLAQSHDSKVEPAPILTKAKSLPPIQPKSPPPLETKPSPPEIAAKPPVLAKKKPEVFPKVSSPSPASSPSNSVRSSVDATKSPTPGKFDFRANLKSRQMQNDNGGKTEPEFKNALGKLKRTQTEKFVAPDTLKDNILRGKAGLSLTGGPAKRERVDELKVSLVKQKAAMQAKAALGEAPKRPEKPANIPATPEALVKRNALQQSQISKDSAIAAKEESSTPEAIARMKSLREKSKPATPQKLTSPSGKTSTSPPLPKKPLISDNLNTVLAQKPYAEEATPSKPASLAIQKASNVDQKAQPFALPGMAKPGVSSKLADRFNPALLGMLARGPPPVGQSGGDFSSTASAPKYSGDTPPTSTEPLEHKTKGRAKGPKRRAPTKQASEPSTETPARKTTPPAKIIPTTASLSRTASNDSSGSGDKPPVVEPSVQSMKSVSSTYKSEDQLSTPVKHSRTSSASFPAISLVKPKDILPSSPNQPGKVFDRTTPKSSEKSSILKQKPMAPIKSPLLSGRTAAQTEDEPDTVLSQQPKLSPKPQPQSARAPLQEQESSRKLHGSSSVSAATRALPSPPTAKSPSLHEDPAVNTSTPLYHRAGLPTPPSTAPRDSPATPEQTSNVSVKNVASLWGRQTETTPSSPGRPPSPVKLPTRRDEEKAMVDAGLMAPPEVPSLPKKPLGLGLGISDSTNRPASSVAKTADRSPNKLPISPPMSTGLAAQSHDIKSTILTIGNNPAIQIHDSKPLPIPPESPIPHTSEASRLFADFFNDNPVVIPDEDMDTIAILESYPVTFEKVKTIRKQLHEMTSDGKLSAVPSHQEHMLFEESMYICIHVFEIKGSRTTEVYLWAGSGVPQAAMEDAQLFARKAARDNNGKFLILHQGEETPNFLQALGGIVIIFRGARSRTSMGVPNKFVLCGRRHMGHICFDEVDFSLHSFFSGFPYLISSDSRLYLWKGVGCHQEELSSARLITMDVSSMPDLTEVEEGHEPASFFALFPSLPKYPINTVPRSADHWRRKSSYDRYRCRLFRVEQHGNNRGLSSLQVSNFFSNVIARRPSWSSLSARNSPTEEQPPKTPTTPRSPARPTGSPLPPSITTRIVEIAPFTQGDVDAGKIYVLDAFFEIYIIIGPLAQSQSHACATALLFAQDYGIIAAGMEDRPFVPIPTVVLEGVPRDMKPCFRNWRDEDVVGGTEALMAGKPRRGRSLRCVGLDAALAATRAR